MSLLRQLRSRRADKTSGAARRLAEVDFSLRNPIVVIPGIMGSRLIAAGSAAELWGGETTGFARPESDEEMRSFTFPMELGKPLDRLGGDVITDGTVGAVAAHLGGLSLRINTYGDLLSALGVASYTETHAREAVETRSAVAFEFSYDWRRSLDESAQLLHEFLLRAARFVTVQRGLGWAPRFDVVAHSMGGLLLRYYLRYGARPLALDGETMPCDWAGAEMVERAIIAASPAGGSLMAIERLLAGLPGNPVHPGYDTTVPGSMPALYQLLPRTASRPLVDHEGGEPDLLDFEIWQSRGWGLAASDVDETLSRLLVGVESRRQRRAVALDHLEKCLCAARAFHRALDRRVPSKPEHLKLHFMVGGQRKTPARALATGGAEAIRIIEYGAGDATVLASSALLDQRGPGDGGPLASPLQWDSVTMVPGDHLGLTREPTFLDNLVYRLVDDPGQAYG